MATPPSASANALSSRPLSATPPTEASISAPETWTTDVVRGLEGPCERALGENGHRAVPHPYQPHEVRPDEQQRVIATQALHAHADSRVFGQVNRERRLDAIIGPLPAAVDDHALAAVLRDAKGLRKVGRENARLR